MLCHTLKKHLEKNSHGLSSLAHAVVSSPDSDQNIYPPSPDSETMHSISYGTSHTHLRMCILWIPLLRFTLAVLHPRHTCEIILFGPNAVNFSHSFPIFIMLRKSEMRADWEGQELPLKLQGSLLVHYVWLQMCILNCVGM